MKYFYLILIFFIHQPLTFSAETKIAKKSECIIFLGDSITQCGMRSDGYVTLTKEEICKKYPDFDIKIIGAGLGGHRVPDLQARLNRDVINKKPTIVVIYIGINDVWLWRYEKGTSKKEYELGLQDIIERINEAGARIILCTPSVIGEKTDGTNKYDKLLDEYSEISREVAFKTNSQLLDLRKYFKEYLEKNNKDNLYQGILTGDGVHLNEEGNRFVAKLMAEALGIIFEEIEKSKKP